MNEMNMDPAESWREVELATMFMVAHKADMMIHCSGNSYGEPSKRNWFGQAEIKCRTKDGNGNRNFKAEVRSLETPMEVLVALHQELLHMTDGDTAKAMLASVRAPVLTHEKEILY